MYYIRVTYSFTSTYGPIKAILRDLKTFVSYYGKSRLVIKVDFYYSPTSNPIVVVCIISLHITFYDHYFNLRGKTLTILLVKLNTS